MKRSNLKWNELKAAGFQRICISNRIPTSHYNVNKPSHLDWPEDKELISFCDGAEGMNFGGAVKIYENTAYIDVYID